MAYRRFSVQETATSKARRLCAAALAFSFCLPATAAHTEDAVTAANRTAYGIAMQCFVADGVASGDSEDAGDQAKAVAFDAKAKRSFDAAMNLGDALHYSDTRVNRDMGIAQAAELPRMVKDKAYLKRTLDLCATANL